MEAKKILYCRDAKLAEAGWGHSQMSLQRLNLSIRQMYTPITTAVEASSSEPWIPAASEPWEDSGIGLLSG